VVEIERAKLAPKPVAKKPDFITDAEAKECKDKVGDLLK